MSVLLGGLGPDRFLAEFWQKKPLLIRQALPDFHPALDADDIAGLATDELAESRIVTGRFPDPDWQVRYGPFSDSDFSALPDRDWTLLVQDVEKHYPPLQELLDRFSFLPRWRIDDLMVSVAGPGGSVGPHVDQYDVFLLQAAGRRRWQVAERFDPELLADSELNVLATFEPEDEWELEPGDMLYLPPGVAHHGIALDAGMTWSLGMRAPSAADLLQALGEWLADRRAEGSRYADPDLQAARDAGQVDRESLERLRDLCRTALADDSEFGDFAGSFLSTYRLAHQPAPPDRAMQPDELADRLAGGAVLQHNPWTRLLWMRNGESARLFAAGSAIRCDVVTARTICDADLLQSAGPELSSDQLELCLDLLNQGHLYLG